MTTSSRRAKLALLSVSAVFALFLLGLGTASVLGVRSAAHTASSVASDEMVTATATAQLSSDADAAYAAGLQTLGTADPTARRSAAIAQYLRLVPRVDVELDHLEQLHADDPTAERRDVGRLRGQWAAVRAQLDPALLAGPADPGAIQRLDTAFQPLRAHLDRLVTTERVDATQAQAQAESSGQLTGWLVAGLVVGGLLVLAGAAWVGSRRLRRAIEPQQEQIDFAETLQIAADEEEAHHLLQRHLERTLPAATAVVLNRNNSADRLEAVTPLPDGSPLSATLSAAEPRSCLAVRSGRAHHEAAGTPGLLACSVCSVNRGHSTCTPLTVGGEVIGSVLLNRTAVFSAGEDRQIEQSVSQAAPVLANLRNLAIAEIRAATDSLTGLPNKRAVTDTLKRMFAQATRTGGSLSLVLLDLDHFKDINDRHGHPVGDQVLANVGAVLRSSLRPADFCGRNGGEEFALLLPDTDLAAGHAIAERIRLSIAEISVPGLDLAVSASLGIATYPEHTGSPDRLERLADAALYLAKRSGRNRTEVADATAEAASPGPGTGDGAPAGPITGQAAAPGAAAGDGTGPAGSLAGVPTNGSGTSRAARS